MAMLARIALCAALGLPLLAAGPARALSITATLTGAQEVPPNASPATGSVTITLTGDTLNVSLTFSGLTGGPASAAHIHCCASPGTNAIVAIGFPGFPNAASGTYVHDFDLTDATLYSSTFLTNNGGTAGGAEAALVAGLEGGLAYVNIHNQTFPGGEIRGLLVPEPATAVLLTSALLGAGAVGRTRPRGCRRA